MCGDQNRNRPDGDAFYEYLNQMDLFFQRIEFMKGVWAGADDGIREETFYALMDIADKYRMFHEKAWMAYEGLLRAN